MYPEGSFFEGLFREFPEVHIRLTSSGIIAYDNETLTTNRDERPDGDAGRLWDFLQAIPDLM